VGGKRTGFPTGKNPKIQNRGQSGLEKTGGPWGAAPKRKSPRNHKPGETRSREGETIKKPMERGSRVKEKHEVAKPKKREGEKISPPTTKGGYKKEEKKHWGWGGKEVGWGKKG